jgi:hypothetical protein
MAYITAEARRELLDTVAEATRELGAALATLGEAYEALDEQSADTLEEELFRPVQVAFGRARRTHDGFAARHGFAPLDPGPPAPAGRAVTAGDLKGLVDAAVDAVQNAEDILVELQDSMSPVEVGDAELRAGLADVRAALAVIAERAERFVSRFGR